VAGATVPFPRAVFFLGNPVVKTHPNSVVAKRPVVINLIMIPLKGETAHGRIRFSIIEAL